jgi:phosphoenolpyruvate---glycerone phosphotransferase subunit DhaL
MSDGIDCRTLIHMLKKAAGRVRDNQTVLSRLDSFGGDGDHGTTMARAVGQIEKVILAAEEGTESVTTSAFLRDVGWAVMGIDGGATGPLFGSFFTAMGDYLDGTEQETLDVEQLAATFRAGLEGVQKYTKARVGDKTMIDALDPAVRAIAFTAEAGGDARDAILIAADAAERGAVSTKDMQARFGRARNMGPKSVGNEDPGAASVALFFRGFADGVKNDG